MRKLIYVLAALALGALYTPYSWPSQEARVQWALEVATYFCPSVRPPNSVLCTAAEEAA